jgi:glycosyltransferase involved in cell wall biosynthesis
LLELCRNIHSVRRRSTMPNVINAGLRVAIVQEWLVTLGGSEYVLAQLMKIFPQADVFTLVHTMSDEQTLALGVRRVVTSPLQRITAARRNHRNFLPLFPAAVRSLDVSAYDLVISNSHAVGKGVRTHHHQTHICYCLSPMRYAWDLREQYLRESGLDHGVRGVAARMLLEALRRWDRSNTRGVDSFATLSHYIAERIRRAYGRESTVIYPPVDTDFYTPGEEPPGDYFVTASRFVPYKKIDTIAQAFALLPRERLVIVGDGPDRDKIRAVAGPNVELVGHTSRERLRALLRGAKAFIFAADEDFGIAPVEAQACGTPVIAFGRGGARETVVGVGDETGRPPTGLFFGEQTPEAIAAAVGGFGSVTGSLSAQSCRSNAERFSESRFRMEMSEFISSELGRELSSGG